MTESSDARDAVVRFYERLSGGDAEGAAAAIASDPAAFVIGTQRIGDGRDQWIESVRESIGAGVAFEAGAIRAWAEGDMGWAVDEPAFVLPDGTRLQARMTAVLRRDDDGSFRLLHQHFSWAVPDEVGIEHATAWREQLGLVAA